MAKDDAVAHRRIARTTLAHYEGRDNRCVRDVLCWLLLGPDSTRSGLRYCRPPALANELGWSVANIEAAIARLVADGHVTYSPAVRTLLCHDALTCTRPANDSHRTSLRREIDVYQTCAATSKAVEMLGANSDTVRRTVSDTVPDTSMQGAGCSDQNAVMQELPAAQEAVASATPARASEPEQLQLAIKETKPKKAKPKSVEDAEMLHATWNQGAAQVDGWTHCSRCDGAVRTVLARAYKIMVEALPIDEEVPDQPVVDALKWALCDPYWSGTKFGKPWGILQFFSSHNVDKMLADYNRSRRGEYNG